MFKKDKLDDKLDNYYDELLIEANQEYKKKREAILMAKLAKSILRKIELYNL